MPNNTQEIQALLDEFMVEIELQTQQCNELKQYIRDATNNRQALQSNRILINYSIASTFRSVVHRKQGNLLMGENRTPLGLIVSDREERIAELLDVQAKIAKDQFDHNARLISSMKKMAHEAEERLKRNEQRARLLQQKLQHLSISSTADHGMSPDRIVSFLIHVYLYS